MTDDARSQRTLVALGGALGAALVLLVGSAGAAQRYLEQVTVGPNGGNGPHQAPAVVASADGSRVFFLTGESLVPEDTDATNDVYERSSGTTTLVSVGPMSEAGTFFVDGPVITPDGAHAYFSTREKLVTSDTDTTWDIYDRSGGVTTLVSVGPGGNSLAGFPSPFPILGVSDDGGTVYFATIQGNPPLTSQSIYRRSGGTTTLVFTLGPGDGSCGTSPNGSRIWVSSYARLTPDDTDPAQGSPRPSYGDVFEWNAGVTTLVSTGPTTTNAAADAFCYGASEDGARVFFTTREALVSGDTDSNMDYYERSGGQTTLLSTGVPGGGDVGNLSGAGSSADGSHAYFVTEERLAPEDTDTARDLYERAAGMTTLVSIGPVGGNDDAFGAAFAGATADGARLFFSTLESIVPEDTDASTDYYERSGGQTTLVSTGPSGGSGDYEPNGLWVPRNGANAFFTTNEPLVAGDTDDQIDVYERTGTTTRLVSIGPAGGNGAFPALVSDVTDDGGLVFVSTGEALLAGDTDDQSDVYAATPVAEDGASESVGAGGTVSTGGLPTPEDPVETSVTTPNAGTVTISETDETGSAPAGFELLGLAVDITAPSATAANPLTLVFRLDGSLLAAAGLDHTTVQVLKDGVPVPDCDTAVPADPDPCLAQRSPLGSGGAELTVSTSTASLWAFGREVVVDSSPPTITPSVTGTLGSNGWYVGDVDVSWTVEDPESAISSSTGCDPTTVDADTTGLELTCEATSAGGTASASVTVTRDATDPTVTCSFAAPGPVFLVGGVGGNVSAGVSDLTSGPVAASVAAPAAVSSVGNKSVLLTGVDRAGNTAGATCTYRVSYVIVAKSPANGSRVKPGSTVPVKFGLASASGSRIVDTAAQALVAGCKVKVGLTSATGCATYATSSDQFQFDVKTPKNGTGNHTLVIEVFAPDGSGLVNRTAIPIVLR
jgi:hypothetical protein